MNPSKSFTRLAAGVLAGLIACAAPSYAYRMIQSPSTGRVTGGYAVSCGDPGGFAHWGSPNISWYHNTAGQGAGKASPLQAAMNNWSWVDSSPYVHSYIGTTLAGWSTDGQNTILWDVGNGCSSSTGCLALTALVMDANQLIVESDITFNDQITWRTDGGNHDTQAVATHELGHALGIHHTGVTTTPRPTMYADYFGTGARSLESDDIAALECSESRYPHFPPLTCEEQCGVEHNNCTDSCYTDPDQGWCFQTCDSEYQFCLMGCGQ